VKPTRHKSRQVTSRYLSSTPNSSPNTSISPVRHKPTSRKLRPSFDDPTTKPLWPSSTPAVTTSKRLDTTLAEHLGSLSLKDLLLDTRDHHPPYPKPEEECHSHSHSGSLFLNRHRSSGEVGRFESRKNTKENHKPVFVKSKLSKSEEPTGILPRRLSVDENALSRSRKSASRIGNVTSDEDGCASNDSGPSAGLGKTPSFASYMSSTATSRRNGIHVSSKFMQEPTPTSGLSDDASVSKPVSLEDSPKLHKSILKNAMRRANSLTGYGSVMSQWALSPGRSASPIISVENKGKLLKTFSNLKPPPTSPQKSATGVEKLFSMGIDLFKTKKSPVVLSAGPANGEGVHQLRLLHSRLMQWRLVNVKAETACENVTKQAEMNLLNAQETLARFRHSVMQKRLKFQRESLLWKLNCILHSQMQLLETWGEIERLHTSAVSMTKDYLLAVVCKVPLIEGAKADTQLASLMLRHASELTSSIKSMLSTFSPMAAVTSMLLSELAEVVAKENFLIEECLEMSKEICFLEVHQRLFQ
uniref:QWRF motif-containing protein 3 n=1 Tax=Kalanchoe fedtschenkoi TaxID=63787 RepID=A0A7N0V9L0_KALFE